MKRLDAKLPGVGLNPVGRNPARTAVAAGMVSTSGVRPPGDS